MRQQQEKSTALENQARVNQYPTGLRELLSSVTGQSAQLAEEHRQQAYEGKQRDRTERQDLVNQQMRERRDLQFEIEQARYHHQLSHQTYTRELGPHFKLDPTQPFIAQLKRHSGFLRVSENSQNLF